MTISDPDWLGVASKLAVKLVVCVGNEALYQARRLRAGQGHRQGGRGRAHIAGAVGRRGGEALAAVGQRPGRVGPRPAAVGGSGAQLCCVVEDRNRAVCFRRAGQRHRIAAHGIAGDHRRCRRRGVDLPGCPGRSRSTTGWRHCRHRL